jgi:hypothetical protein
MVMKHEDHEALLNELLTPELETSRKTEILQSLRVDYGSVRVDHENLTKQTEKLNKENSDLVISNSMLFRQQGFANANPDEKKKDEQKEFSETVTIEQLEKG